jgi:hypothetical protein
MRAWMPLDPLSAADLALSYPGSLPVIGVGDPGSIASLDQWPSISY